MKPSEKSSPKTPTVIKADPQYLSNLSPFIKDLGPIGAGLKVLAKTHPELAASLESKKEQIKEAGIRLYVDLGRPGSDAHFLERVVMAAIAACAGGEIHFTFPHIELHVAPKVYGEPAQTPSE